MRYDQDYFARVLVFSVWVHTNSMHVPSPANKYHFSVGSGRVKEITGQEKEKHFWTLGEVIFADLHCWINFLIQKNDTDFLKLFKLYSHCQKYCNTVKII